MASIVVTNSNQLMASSIEDLIKKLFNERMGPDNAKKFGYTHNLEHPEGRPDIKVQINIKDFTWGELNPSFVLTGIRRTLVQKLKKYGRVAISYEK